METNRFDRQRILIVDDNPKNLQILGKFLQTEPFVVEFALNGTAALEWLRIQTFDLVLLDINMPGIDGFTVCKMIREDHLMDHMPIIFLTAQTDRESILKGFKTGAQDYISKPFDSQELLARVKTQLEIKRNRDMISNYLDIIRKKNNQITESINYALYIQNAFQKASEKHASYFNDTFSLLLPKDVLSGDFYYYKKIGDKLIAGVFDGTGHGIPGAFISILGITFLNEIIVKESCTQLDAILNRLRDRIIESFDQKGNPFEVSSGMDGAMISYDSHSKILSFAGAYCPLYVVRNDDMIELNGDRMPMAYHSEVQDFAVKELQVKKDDNIYLSTDGYTDQFGGPDDKKYGKNRFRQDLLKNAILPLHEQRSLLLEHHLQWRGSNEQTDDITVLGIKL